MTGRRMQCVVLFLVFLLSMPWAAWAEKVDDVAAANRLAQAFGGKEQSGLIENALRSVSKYQLSRYKRDVTFEKPLDFRVLSDRHVSVAFEATVKKAGSARAKGAPAVYVLLFLKKPSGGLDHQMQDLLILNDAREVAAYPSMTDAQLAGLFRKGGVDVKVVAVPREKAPKKPAAKAAPVFSGSSINQGVVQESFIDDSITRDTELQQALAGYARKEDIPKMLPVMKGGSGSPELQLRITELENKVKALEALLANVTRQGGNIYFNGVNLYVTNGTGQADKVNGKGNVILGYGSSGKGSHNLVVGGGNRYDGYGGVVSGRGNALSGNCAVVLGGEKNTVSGDFSVLVGGKKNKAPGTYATILGGSDNTAKGAFASINGQSGRTKGGKNPHFSSKETNE